MAAARLFAPILGAVVLLGLCDAVYVVGQTQQAVLLDLGRPAEVINAGPTPSSAGLHFKWPFIEQVETLDRRALTVRAAPVDSSGGAPTATPLQADLRYRITDPVRFHQVFEDQAAGGRSLSQLLQDSLGRTLAGTHDPENGRGALETAMLGDLRARAEHAKLGVAILDVRLADAPLSPSTVESITQRMQNDETRQVAEIKFRGEQTKRDLMAQADRDAADVRAEGERQALETRGDGDAQRAAILGAAYSKDPGFARFFRRLEAYDQALNPDTTVLVLSPDNAFLNLFGNGPGATTKSPR